MLAIESIGMAVQAPPEIQSGYWCLREDAGVVKPGSWGLVEVKGPDAVEFLQGQVTNDVEALEPGRGCYALLLNPKGRILADMRILMRGPEELWLDGQAAPMETVATHLKTYRIGRQVEVAPIPRSDRDVVSVIGPGADAAGVRPPASEHSFAEAELNGAPTVAVATHLGMDLIFASRDAAAVEGALSESLPRVPEEAAEILRIERGRPRLGIDMSDENLPGELGLEERAVSFTKGCYIGQEPVARMHHRGHPNRHLRGLALSKPASGGEPVTSANGDSGGTEVGRIGSATVSPTFGPIALALIRREVEVGSKVLAGGAAAELVPLPFGSD